MGKKLAIKGHSSRGKEVIELLEMLGGKNCYNFSGFDGYAYYVIAGCQNKIKAGEYIFGDEDVYFFTLEEFLEKYPFKVGDKVVYTKFGDNCDEYPVTIESMKWTGTTIEYTFNDCVTCLAKDLRMCNGETEEPDKAKAPKLKGEDYSGKRFGYKIPDGYEFDVVVDGKIFLKPIKPKYPKTYDECCNELINYDKYRGITVAIAGISYKANLINSFTKLLICRDAYWKIAGKELGLGKPWEPDLENEELYCIQNYNKQITISRTNTAFNKILIFPTEKMRDAFYENFKNLIEQCKELL